MSKLKFILYCMVLNCTVIFLGSINVYAHFLGIGLILFIGGIYLFKRSPFKNKLANLFFIFGLWTTLISYASILSFFNTGFGGFPLLLITLCSILAVLILYQKEIVKNIHMFVLYAAFVAVLTYYLPNYYAFVNHKVNSIVNEPMPDIKVFNEEKELVDLKKNKGKIIVLDLWNNTCGICIREFPKFESLKKEFESDSTIVFYSLNLPLTHKEKAIEINKKFTKEFSFNKLYTSIETSKKLNIYAVPEYMIVDKNYTIRYLGQLNTDRAYFYNNFYDIINEIK